MTIADAGWFASRLILQGGGRLAGTTRDDFLEFCRRNPDVRMERNLTEAERNKFAPSAPDFLIEVRSESERLPQLREKMQEYAENGVRLGWLIDPIQRRVEIYRPGAAPITLDNPATVSGEPELPGLTLDLAPIW